MIFFEKTLLIGSLLSFLLSVLIIFLNKRFNQIFSDDMVGVQKFHTQPTPRLGGLAIAISYFIMIIFLEEETRKIWSLIGVAALPILITGLIEDIWKNVKPLFRLITAILSGIIFIVFTQYSINSLDFFYLNQVLSFYFISLIFTSFAMAGVVNAVNIIDGFNGLALGSLIIILSTFGIIAFQIQDFLIFNLTITFILILVGIFIVNFPFGKIFMGDAGAYFCGFFLSCIAIMLPFRNDNISPWVSFLICSYPIIETIFSIYRKNKRKGHHPSKPDGLHLHMLVYRDLSRRLSYKLNIIHFRNSITSIIMYFIPLFSCITALLTYNNKISIITMSILTLFIYLIFYKKVSLN